MKFLAVPALRARGEHVVIYNAHAFCCVRSHPVAVPGALHAGAVSGWQVLDVTLVSQRTP